MWGWEQLSTAPCIFPSTRYASKATQPRKKMDRANGFSLTEVLVSLLLLTTTLLGLLKQQWHISQLFNQTHMRINTLLQQDNASERSIGANF